MTGDLHVHTIASDGLMTPAEAVAHAAESGLNVLSVTDHDTVFSVAEVKKLCRERGICAVAGIEVSAYEGALKVHTLGYGFDPGNAGFVNFCKKLYNNSFVRAADVIKKLRALGVDITLDDALARRSNPDIPIHSMHIAAAGAEKINSPDRFAFYRKYMMPGCPAYSDLCRPSPGEAISVINAAGGIAVLAHPGRIDLPLEGVIGLTKHLVSLGLGGIEAYYPAHTEKETEIFIKTARELNLYVTGGSDTHFYGGNRRIGTPRFVLSDALCGRLNIC